MSIASNLSFSTATSILAGTAGAIVYQSAANTTAFLSIGTGGYVLTSNGTSPAWSTTASLYVGNAVVSTNLRAGVAGQLHYQSGVDTSGYITTATTGNFLQANYNGVPTWTSTGSMYVSRAVFADSASGSAGSVTNSVTFNNAGSGDASGTTFNGSAARTISYNTLGAMPTTGGTFSGPVTFSSAVTFSGTATYVLSTNTWYTDNILELHVPTGGVSSPWFADDGKDIGFRFHYYTASTDTNAALVLANDTKWLEWYSAGAEGTSTFAGSTYGNFKTGGIWATTGAGVGYTSSQVGEKFGVNGGTYVNGTLTATTFVGAMSQVHTAGTGLSGSTYNGSAAVTWTLNTATLMQTAVNLAGGSAGQFAYQSAANTTAFMSTSSMYVNRAVYADSASGSAGSVANALTIGTGLTGSPSSSYNGSAAITVTLNTATLVQTATQVVQSHSAGTGLTGSAYNGSTAQTWSLNTATLMANAVTAINLSAGSAMALPYQSASGTTAYLSAGTSGYILQTNGTGSAPSWVAASGLSAGSSTNADNLKTIAQPTGGTYYPTFVDSNNSTAAYEAHYTTSSFVINPTNGTGGVGAASFGFNTLNTFVTTGTYNFIVNARPRFNGMMLGNGDGSDTATNRILFDWSSGVEAHMYAQQAVPLLLGTNNTEVMRVMNGGGLAIGTTSLYTAGSTTTGLLSVAGAIVGGDGTSTAGSVLVANRYGSGFLTVLGSEYSSGGPVLAYGMRPSTTGAAGFNNTYGGGGALSYSAITQDGNIKFYTRGSATYNVGDAVTISERMRITTNGGIAFGGSSNYGSSGQVLQSNGDAAPTWVNASTITAGSASLTSTYVGFGSGSNTLTGSSSLTWNGTTLYVNGRIQTPGYKVYNVTTGGQGNVNSTYEIMRIGRDSANWSTNIGYEVTVRSAYYSGGGVTSWYITYGYGDAGTISCIDARGGTKHRVYLGTEVTVSGNIKYIPVYVDIPNYYSVAIEVKYNTTEVTTFTSSGQVYFTGTMATGTGSLYGGDTHLVPSGGNVGIGTTSPGAKLEVAMSRTSSTSGIALQLSDNVTGGQTDGVYKSIRSASNSGNSVSEIRFLETDGSNNNTSIAFATQSTAGGLTERMRITQTGALAFAGAANYGSSGQILQSNGNASPTWVNQSAIAAGSAPLTSTYVGYGSGSNTLTGSSGLTYASSILNVSYQNSFNTTTPGTGTYGIHLNGQSTNDYATGITFSAGGNSAGSAQSGIYSQGSGSYGTKMYFATTDSYASGAKTRMMIDHGGNVGIGTISPSVRLHVAGSAIIANNTSINPDSYANQTVAGGVGDGSWGVSSAVGGNVGTGKSWAIGHNGSYLYFGVGNNTAAGSLASYMVVGGTTRNLWLVPSTGGNVAIGFAEGSGASHRLDINAPTTYSYSQSSYSSGATIGLRAAGTSANDYTGIRFTNSNGSREAFFGVVQGPTSAIGDFVFQTYSAFTTSYAERMRVQHNGNVVIGANGNTSTNKFEVQGLSGQLFSVSDSFTGTIFSANDVSGIPSIEVLDTGLVKFAQYNGSVAISTGTAVSGSALSVYGIVSTIGSASEIRGAGEITAYYSSDLRLKENISVISNPVEMLSQIRGVFYDWTDEQIARRGGEDGYFVRKHDIGVIAQEVEQVLPEVVATRDDGYKAVRYEKLVPLLIEAIKTQQDELTSLKYEMSEIKKWIQSQKG